MERMELDAIQIYGDGFLSSGSTTGTCSGATPSTSPAP